MQIDVKALVKLATKIIQRRINHNGKEFLADRFRVKKQRNAGGDTTEFDQRKNNKKTETPYTRFDKAFDSVNCKKRFEILELSTQKEERRKPDNLRFADDLALLVNQKGTRFSVKRKRSE